jgi:hypothetical protein
MTFMRDFETPFVKTPNGAARAYANLAYIYDGGVVVQSSSPRGTDDDFVNAVDKIIRIIVAMPPAS